MRNAWHWTAIENRKRALHGKAEDAIRTCNARVYARDSSPRTAGADALYEEDIQIDTSVGHASTA